MSCESKRVLSESKRVLSESSRESCRESCVSKRVLSESSRVLISVSCSAIVASVGVGAIMMVGIAVSHIHVEGLICVRGYMRSCASFINKDKLIYYGQWPANLRLRGIMFRCVRGFLIECRDDGSTARHTVGRVYPVRAVYDSDGIPSDCTAALCFCNLGYTYIALRSHPMGGGLPRETTVVTCIRVRNLVSALVCNVTNIDSGIPNPKMAL